jgi:hypothetical protein
MMRGGEGLTYFSAMSDEQPGADGTPREPVVIRQADGTPYAVPPEGSLALLALGYRGLMAWRARRAEVQRDTTPKQ